MEVIKNKVGNPHDKHKYPNLSILPTYLNFRGSDLGLPIVCSEFGCPVHLTYEQQLYNPKCYSCQCKVKTDPTSFISHPIKKSA